jgi:2-methylisocitrate lyase-like PEP mutase family enzyme
MAANVAAITDVTDLPVIADADTGYGNAINVRRTVREYERAGAAALHIEDQAFPKLCGPLQGKRLIQATEMAQKIRAAKDARRTDDFVVIARCDAILVDGLDEALRRGHAYVEAGADALFIESPRDEDEIARIGREFDVPLVFNMASSGKTPFLSGADVQRLGFQLMILPNFATLAAIKAMREVLEEIRATGSAAGVRDRCASFDEFMALSGMPEMRELDRRYADPALEPVAPSR